MASASSSSTSCTEVACEVQPKTAALPTVASPSNLVAMGRKLDRRGKSESPTTDRSRAGIALTAAEARLLVRHKHWRARPEPAACVAWVQNFPTRLRRRTIACRRRVAFRQHFLEKL